MQQSNKEPRFHIMFEITGLAKTNSYDSDSTSYKETLSISLNPKSGQPNISGGYLTLNVPVNEANQYTIGMVIGMSFSHDDQQMTKG